MKECVNSLLSGVPVGPSPAAENFLGTFGRVKWCWAPTHRARAGLDSGPSVIPMYSFIPVTAENGLFPIASWPKQEGLLAFKKGQFTKAENIYEKNQL